MAILQKELGLHGKRKSQKDFWIQRQELNTYQDGKSLAVTHRNEGTGNIWKYRHDCCWTEALLWMLTEMSNVATKGKYLRQGLSIRSYQLVPLIVNVESLDHSSFI